MSRAEQDDDWIVLDLPIRFPILTIPEPRPERFWETVNIHFKWDTFTYLDRRELKSREEVGRVLMDYDGRSWRIEDMVATPIRTNGIWDVFWTKTFGYRRAKYQLSNELGLSLGVIKDRISTIIRAHPDAWRDDEAGESGVMPIDEEEALNEFLSKVAAAKSPLELMAVIEFQGRLIG